MERYEYESAGQALQDYKQWNSYLFDELKSAETAFEMKRIIEQIKTELTKNELPKGTVKNAVILLKRKYMSEQG